MARTSFVLTDADKGRVLPVENGYIVDLKKTASGPYEMPQWSEGEQKWKNGRFVLRASGEWLLAEWSG